jgi:murein DD-endopeptidase MepM/ murein hydrolase activator NlpD
MAPSTPTTRVVGVVDAGRFTGRFGTGRSATHRHQGIDISAKEGTPVRAVNAGLVYGAYPDGQRSGYGNSVLIKHPDGNLSFYAHLKSFTVKQGQRVSRGQVIGYVGRTQLRLSPTGRVLPNPRPHMPPHLHMEIQTGVRLRNGVPIIAENVPRRIDPLVYMKRVGATPVGTVV